LKRIIILIPYFGKFPDWVELFFYSIKLNSTIDFCIITDCDFSSINENNIKLIKSSYEDYIKLVSDKLDVKFNPISPYKICDVRPFFGIIHADLIKGYDFFGWTDMDILFGDIRSFYNQKILNSFEVLSTHAIRISGHLALFRNNKKNIDIGKKIYRWKSVLENPNFVGIDEHGITNAYLETFLHKLNDKFKIGINENILNFLSKLKRRKMFMMEQYTTPFTTIPWIDGTINSMHPEEWCFENGIITNKRDGVRKFMYLHFMNFKSSQWRHDGSKAPWESAFIYEVVNFDSKIIINSKGIYNAK